MFLYPLTTFDIDKKLDKIVARSQNPVSNFIKNTTDICESRITKIMKSIGLNL